MIKENKFLTPEKILKRSVDLASDRKRYYLQQKRINLSFIKISNSQDLLIIVLIRPLYRACKETKAVLKEFHLENEFSAVLVRSSPEVLKKLILVKPFIAWGKPTQTTIQQLLTKHAFTMVLLYFLVKNRLMESVFQSRIM